MVKRDPLVPAAMRLRSRVRRKGRSENPLADPLAGIKRPLRSLNGPAPGQTILEFEPIDVLDIRRRFHTSQRAFAAMLGINVETLRNWEQGRRSPHGPSRALLRVAAANPTAVARVLLRSRRPWWWD